MGLLDDVTDEDLDALQAEQREPPTPDEPVVETIWFDEAWRPVPEAEGVWFQRLVIVGLHVVEEAWGRREGAPVRQARVYLKPGQQPPAGVTVHTGPGGGRYYESQGRAAAAPEQPKQPGPAAPQPAPRTASKEEHNAWVDELRAKYRGVALDIYQRADHLVVSRVVVPSDARGKGYGTRVMQDVLERADQLGLAVGLTPSGVYGGQVGRLKEFYARLGFRPNRGRGARHGISEAMVRDPQAPKAPPPPSAPAQAGGDVRGLVQRLRQDPIVQRVEKSYEDSLRGASTATQYRTPDGSWKPERARLHEGVVQGLLNPRAAAAAGEAPKAVFTIGAPGSGKTSVLGPRVQALAPEWTRIDADDARAKLPEYEGWNAPFVHEEASYLARERVTRAAVEARHNVVVDEVGQNPEKVRARMEALAAAGYEVHLFFVDAPAEATVQRVYDRMKATGRGVPLDFVAEAPAKVRTSYEALKRLPVVKSYLAMDNSVPFGQPARLLESGTAETSKGGERPREGDDDRSGR